MRRTFSDPRLAPPIGVLACCFASVRRWGFVGRVYDSPRRPYAAGAPADANRGTIKMRQVAIAWGTLLAAFVSGQSQAQAEPAPGSGNALIDACKAFAESNTPPKSTSAALDQGVCVGAIMAVFHLGIPLGICAPKNATVGQAVRITNLYMAKHPEKLHLQLSNLSMDALHEAWPCAK